MAQKIPGLEPISQDPMSGLRHLNRAPRRVVPDIAEARALRPPAGPVNTYVRPSEPERGNDFLDLAGALQQFSPVLTQAFASVEAKQAAGAEAAVAQSTPEQLQAHVRAGTAPATVTGAGIKAFNRLSAQQLAIKQVSAIDAAWNSGEFDRDNEDFDAFIAGRAEADLKSIQDPAAREAYGAVINKFGTGLRSRATEYKVQQVKGQSLTMVGDTWFAALASGISEKKSPEELNAAIRSQYGYYKETLNLSPQELDGALLGVSRRLAETPGADPYIEHFLNDTRGGIGSIAAKGDSGPTSQVIINRAQSTTRQYQAEQLKIQNKAAADRDAAMVEGRLEVAAENGTLSFMQDQEVRTESGGTKTVSADEQQKAGVDLIRKKAESIAAQGNPEGGMNFRLGALFKNGLVDPQFKSILKAGPSSATHEALEKGTVPPALQAGIDLYETIYARNPRLLAQHVSGEDQFFYEAYRVARQDMNYDKAGALSAAVKFTDTANPQELPASLKQDLSTVREKLAGFREGTWEWTSPTSWFGMNGINAMTVTDEVARKLDRWGEFYVRMGKTPEDAIDLATQRIQSSHTVINGNPVPTTDRTMPANFKDIAEWKAKTWAEKYGAKYGYDPEDLTVSPAGDGQQGVWMIIRKDGEGPVLVDEDDARNALVFSLRGAHAEHQEATRTGIVEQQKAKRARRERSKGAGWAEGGLQ